LGNSNFGELGGLTPKLPKNLGPGKFGIPKIFPKGVLKKTLLKKKPGGFLRDFEKKGGLKPLNPLKGWQKRGDLLKKPLKSAGQKPPF